MENEAVVGYQIFQQKTSKAGKVSWKLIESPDTLTIALLRLEHLRQQNPSNTYRIAKCILVLEHIGENDG